MEPRYTPYDIVEVNSPGKASGTGVVIDYSFEWEDSDATQSVITYTVFMAEAETVVSHEKDLRKIGRLQPPLQGREIVTIKPNRSERHPLTDKRGVIVGSSWEHVTKKWGYAVAVQNGQVWSFSQEDLRGTGIILPADVWEAHLVDQKRTGGRAPFAVSLENL